MIGFKITVLSERTEPFYRKESMSLVSVISIDSRPQRNDGSIHTETCIHVIPRKWNLESTFRSFRLYFFSGWLTAPSITGVCRRLVSYGLGIGMSDFQSFPIDSGCAGWGIWAYVFGTKLTVVRQWIYVVGLGTCFFWWGVRAGTGVLDRDNGFFDNSNMRPKSEMVGTAWRIEFGRFKSFYGSLPLCRLVSACVFMRNACILGLHHVIPTQVGNVRISVLIMVIWIDFRGVLLDSLSGFLLVSGALGFCQRWFNHPCGIPSIQVHSP